MEIGIEDFLRIFGIKKVNEKFYESLKSSETESDDEKKWFYDKPPNYQKRHVLLYVGDLEYDEFRLEIRFSCELEFLNRV